MKANILIFGATSAIAEATCQKLAVNGSSFFLVARNGERLETLSKDLKARGAGMVVTLVKDLNHNEDHLRIIETASSCLSGIDIALLAHGTLPLQKICEKDAYLAINEFQTNCISHISILTHLANYFELRKYGSIVAITSVSGDRGRQSNYIYGSAKGAVSLFMSGLRHRLAKYGVHVMTVKPGLIDTPMTFDFKKGLLWSKPEIVASNIVTGLLKRKNEIYSPGYWRLIMFVIRNLPSSIFNKTRL